MSTPATKRALEKPIRKVVLSAPTKLGTRKRVFVLPGTIHLAYPDQAKTVEWINETGDVAQIWLVNLKDALVPLNGEDLSQPIEIANGAPFAVGVKHNLPEFLRYYQVYCKAIGDYGDGNSSPQMGCP
jgi:hypothetical protein